MCPLYEEFYRKWEYNYPKQTCYYYLTCSHLNVSFTKNPDKYIKYKPIEVEGILNSFFDGQSV